VERGARNEEREAKSESQLNLVAPLMLTPSGQRDEKTREREAEPPKRVWRVVPRAKRPAGPAWVVGKLAHEAIRRWRFPDVAGFDVFLYPHALEAGLTDRAEISNVIREARRLLERFRQHPLWAEMNAAQRWHELPYAVAGDAGIVDLLYRAGQDWIVADFKTDEIRDPARLAEHIHREEYDGQLRRYAEALTAQLASRPRTILVFLDVARQVQVWEP
jgi:ATP-dependent exoDNAse (exonuclease V) beta subunit